MYNYDFGVIVPFDCGLLPIAGWHVCSFYLIWRRDKKEDLEGEFLWGLEHKKPKYSEFTRTLLHPINLHNNKFQRKFWNIFQNIFHNIFWKSLHKEKYLSYRNKFPNISKWIPIIIQIIQIIPTPMISSHKFQNKIETRQNMLSSTGGLLQSS